MANIRIFVTLVCMNGRYGCEIPVVGTAEILIPEVLYNNGILGRITKRFFETQKRNDFLLEDTKKCIKPILVSFCQHYRIPYSRFMVPLVVLF